MVARVKEISESYESDQLSVGPAAMAQTAAGTNMRNSSTLKLDRGAASSFWQRASSLLRMEDIGMPLTPKPIWKQTPQDIGPIVGPAATASTLSSTSENQRTGLSAEALAANAEAAAAAREAIPKPSQLIVELSETARERGVKSKYRSGGVLGRLFCQY